MQTGIDQSLNLLKNLQYKLRNKQSKTSLPSGRYQQTQPLISTYRSKKPSPIIPNCETKYNKTSNYSQLLQQNYQLKTHVQCLINMNEYLKNQLIKQQNYDLKYAKVFHENPEVEILKMEINYLKQINRQKQYQMRVFHTQKQQNPSLRHNESCKLDSRRQPYLLPKQGQKKKKLINTMKGKKKNQGNKTTIQCRLCYH